MIERVQAGDLIHQKYQVERLLGEGGMGYVVSAWHVVLGQRVAIKILKPDVQSHPEVAERFIREARATSRIESQHVARVMDVDCLEDGTPFLVMEYLEGHDLSIVRRDKRPLASREAVEHVIDACAALAEAHALGIVHRDLKPANLFLTRRRDGKAIVKVLDFGISKVTGALKSTTLTQEGVAMGSPEYMAPEQTQSARDVDVRADIWSLGVILYELTTAVGPFSGSSFGDVCAKLLTAKPAPPSRIATDIPPGLEAVILRCLEKDPSKRYPSVEDLRAALLRFGPNAPAPQIAPQIAPQTPPPQTPPPQTPAPKPPPPRAIPAPSSPAIDEPAEPSPQSGHVPASTVETSGSPWLNAPPPRRPMEIPGLATRVEPPPPPARGVDPKLVAGAVGAIALIAGIAFFLGRSRPEDAPTKDAPSASGRFVGNTATVRDTRTKLEWERNAPSAEVDWTGADGYCDKIRLLGEGMRLPSLDELSALSAALRKDPDPLFSQGKTGYFWSQTPVAGVSRQVWMVRISDGDVTAASVSTRAKVRCVR